MPTSREMSLVFVSYFDLTGTDTIFDAELLWCDKTAADVSVRDCMVRAADRPAVAAAATFAPPVPIIVEAAITDTRTATMPAVERTFTELPYPAWNSLTPRRRRRIRCPCFLLWPRGRQAKRVEVD
jgi:hypothetical protein